MENVQRFFFPSLSCYDRKRIRLAANASLIARQCFCLSALPLRLCNYPEIYTANKSLVFEEVGGLFKTNSSVICSLAFPKSGNYSSACGALKR